MVDTTNLSNIYPSITVRISVRDQGSRTETGKVISVNSTIDNPKGIEVSIDGGLTGNVIEVINSVDILKERILHETHFSENKDSFTNDHMSDEVIPKTIQSFLNSNGGSLFLGIKDDGKTIEEKLAGLKTDRDYYETKYNAPMSDDKFKDKLRSELMESLDSNLVSDIRLGELLHFEWFSIDGKIILEINIPASKTPIFYRHIQKTGRQKGKPIEFDVGVTKNNNFELHTTRQLDDFYIRDGSRKVRLSTFQEFTIYFINHFT